MKKAQELLKETWDLSMEKVPVGSIADVAMGDEVMFKEDDQEKNLRGLPGHVRNIRNDMLDVYVGSSLRAEVDPSRVVKLVRKGAQQG